MGIGKGTWRKQVSSMLLPYVLKHPPHSVHTVRYYTKRYLTPRGTYAPNFLEEVILHDLANYKNPKLFFLLNELERSEFYHVYREAFNPTSKEPIVLLYGNPNRPMLITIPAPLDTSGLTGHEHEFKIILHTHSILNKVGFTDVTFNVIPRTEMLYIYYQYRHPALKDVVLRTLIPTGYFPWERLGDIIIFMHNTITNEVDVLAIVDIKQYIYGPTFIVYDGKIRLNHETGRIEAVHDTNYLNRPVRRFFIGQHGAYLTLMEYLYDYLENPSVRDKLRGAPLIITPTKKFLKPRIPDTPYDITLPKTVPVAAYYSRGQTP